MKPLSKKRNNSGTFNIDNPKKMKKIAKVSVQDDKQVKIKKKIQPLDSDVVEGMEFKVSPVKNTKKRAAESDSNEAISPKKQKFTPGNQNGFKNGFKSKKGQAFLSKNSKSTSSGIFEIDV